MESSDFVPAGHINVNVKDHVILTGYFIVFGLNCRMFDCATEGCSIMSQKCIKGVCFWFMSEGSW